MLCVIKCLNEHVHYFNEMGLKCNKTYKYHSEVIMSVPYSFTLLALLRLNIPLSIKYSESTNTNLVLYTKNIELSLPCLTRDPKPINWKLQFQRHQINKLLNITS